MNTKTKFTSQNRNLFLVKAFVYVLSAFFVVVILSGVAHADTYNNSADSQVYATDIFGVHMAWVNNNWEYFATYNNGDFQLNTNTKLVTNTGGVWPDGGSITGTSSSESSTSLKSSVDYSLNSALGQHITGTLVNQMVYNSNSGNYENYVYVYGTSYYESGSGFLPVSFDFSFDV
jgi:hypothetical protein